MKFSIKDNGFCQDGRRVFLNSGEIHYFRIKRELWDKHLDAALEAGLTTVSSYVPWAWHEPEASVFDFEGLTCPGRDLKGWMRRCKERNLNCILKPGPFILAEFRGAGLPDWFFHQYHGEVKMRDRMGTIVQSDGVSLFNPDYLEKVTLWYDQVMPLIRDHETQNGGPVIMMQICNEIGVFSWLAHQADYGNKVHDHFITYLTRKFSGIDVLNRLWGTAYTDFQAIELPPDGKLPYTSPGDRGRDYEWHCFWRTYYGDYLRLLTGMARERGVTVPVYHNLPGWIYGNGYEFPVNITMYDDLFGDPSGILFGVDHIPEFVSYRNLHDDRIINDITLAVQGNKPLFAAEFQCGSREYHVVPNPREMELFYKASIANGITGLNYYMFSQGKNPPGKGYSGETFYWFNPLTPEGEKTNVFPLVQRMSQLVKAVEPLIVHAQRRAEICVLFYPPYYATELERPVDAACGLTFVASAIRRPAYFDGLLKALQVLNIDYDMVDLSKASVGALLGYKQVWAFSTDEMNARDQSILVEYTRAGGNMVLFPFLPDREMSQKPCTILRDALSVTPCGIETIDSPLIDLFDLKDIKCANPQAIYAEESLAGARVFSRTLRNSVCGFIKPLGKGSLIHLGAWVGFDTESHKRVYEALLEQSGARLRQADATNDFLIVRERFTKEKSGFLFIGNYYNEDQSGKVMYRHPADDETITIPYREDVCIWPGLYGVLIPVCLDVAPGIRLLHTTSDVLGISVEGSELHLTLYGHRDLAGEIVFEGPDVANLKTATLDGIPLQMMRDEKRVVFVYQHCHNQEMIMKVSH